MSIYGRILDILLAMICMFLLPFIAFETELKSIAADKAGQEADILLDRVILGNTLTKNMADELKTNDNALLTGRKCSIEIRRTEYLPGENGCHIIYSEGEVDMLLEKYMELPLRQGDKIIVKIYGKALFGRTRTLLVQRSIVL